MTADRFVFLICSERSGSNLLTSMLNGHPAVSAPPPSHLFRLFSTNAQNYGSLENEENWRILLRDVEDAFSVQLGIWSTVPSADDLAACDLERSAIAPVAALYRAEADHDGADMIFVKENHTERFAVLLQDAMPGCRFVFMVRDPRDVANSYLTTDGISGGVERAVEVWKSGQAETQQLLGRPNIRRAIHCLRYEDLLADTPGELAKIADFLGLSYDPAMLEFHRDDRVRRNAQRIDAWRNLARPVQGDNAGKYRESLKPAEIEYVELCCGALMREFEYSPDIVTELPGDAEIAHRTALLRPSLRRGSYRIETAAEIEMRRRRLAMIETVKSRCLS